VTPRRGSGYVEVQRGEVRRRSLLGTEATYRVLDTERDGVVRVEVIEAPGLPPGRVLRFLTEAVAGMELVSGPAGWPADADERTARFADSTPRAS
jgi:hypothetical protein